MDKQLSSKEIVQEKFKEWLEIECLSDVDFNTDYTKEQQRFIFLNNVFLGIITYDNDLDIEFGKTFIDVISHIHYKTTSSYISNDTDYKKYILSCHHLKKAINWGSSIRSAWFDYSSGFLDLQDPLIINDDEIIKKVPISEEFIDWFIQFSHGSVD